MNELLKVTCDRCGKTWETKSLHILVSCTSCGKKVKIREIEPIKTFKKETEIVNDKVIVS